MLGNIGFTEILVILVIALIFFGPKKLPEMGKAIGSAVTEFKKGLSGQVDAEVKPAEPAKQIPVTKQEDSSSDSGSGNVSAG